MGERGAKEEANKERQEKGEKNTFPFPVPRYCGWQDGITACLAAQPIVWLTCDAAIPVWDPFWREEEDLEEKKIFLSLSVACGVCHSHSSTCRAVRG
jgi:hypothetical protein